jgi:hypothetical protein
MTRFRLALLAIVASALAALPVYSIGDDRAQRKPQGAMRAAHVLPNVGQPRYMAITRAGHYKVNPKKNIRPSAAALKVLNHQANVTAQFDVTYDGFTPDAQQAFQAAVNVWGAQLSTPVTIRVEAHWTPLGPGVLGSAGPNDMEINFTNAPMSDTWYPVALANKIAGTDLAPGRPHIVANFSSVFSNWYTGTDGNTPADKYDLMSVVTHELGHGLGFIGSMNVDASGQGSWGNGTSYPFAFDRFTGNSTGQSLLDTSIFPNPSTALAGQLTSNQLFWFGQKGTAAAGGAPGPVLYAPATWEQGSSYSHLDETTYPAGNPNSLMTPQLGMGEAIHDPGPICMAIFSDMGW